MSPVPAPRQGEIMALQYGRGLAALAVCLFHTYGLSGAYFDFPSKGKIFHFGHSGVEFFFILSGFIILIAHRRDIGKPSQLGTFAVKRIIRIVPMFWLIVIPLGFLFLAVPQFGSDRQLTLGKFLLDIFLVPREGTLTLSPAWTLQHEIVFYLLFSTLLLNRLLGTVVLVGWQVICLVVMLFALTPYDYLLPINKLVGYFNFGFAVGLAIAILYRSAYFESNQKLLKICGVVGLFLLAGMAVGEWMKEEYFLGGGPQLNIAYFCVYGLIILGMLTIERKPRPFLDSTFGLLGGASYALYLTHEPVASVFIKLLIMFKIKDKMSADVGYWSIIMVCVTVALLLHVLVERPFLKWLRGRTLLSKGSAVQVNAA